MYLALSIRRAKQSDGRKALRRLALVGVPGIGVLLALGFAAMAQFDTRACRKGREATFVSRALGQVTVWRDERTGGLYYVRSAEAMDSDARSNVTGIRGKLLLLGSGGGPRAGRGVSALKFDSLKLLARQLPGGFAFYRELRRHAINGTCHAPPSAIRGFLIDARRVPPPIQEYYGSAANAQRNADWPMVWGGRRLAGIPFRQIAIERTESGVRTVMVFYVEGSRNLTLWEMKAGSGWATATEAQLRKGFRVGAGRLLDVAHGPPSARVGSTILIFGSDHLRTRSEWIAIVRKLRAVRISGG